MSLLKRLKRLYTAPIRLILNAQMKALKKMTKTQAQVLFSLCTRDAMLRRQRTMRDPAFSQPALDECQKHIEDLKQTMAKCVAEIMYLEMRLEKLG